MLIPLRDPPGNPSGDVLGDPLSTAARRGWPRNTAAAAINADLVAEDTGLAVERRRASFSAASEADDCERVLGQRRHGLTGAHT